MADRTYNVNQLALQGKTRAAVKSAKKGDKVIVVVEGVFREFADGRSAHAGDYVIGKVAVGEVQVLTGDEFDDFNTRLAEQRRIRQDDVNPDQERIVMPGEEYEGKSKEQLKKLCKERALSQSGTMADLKQRLIDNDD